MEAAANGALNPKVRWGRLEPASFYQQVNWISSGEGRYQKTRPLASLLEKVIYHLLELCQYSKDDLSVIKHIKFAALHCSSLRVLRRLPESTVPLPSSSAVQIAEQGSLHGDTPRWYTTSAGSRACLWGATLTAQYPLHPDKGPQTPTIYGLQAPPHSHYAVSGDPSQQLLFF